MSTPVRLRAAFGFAAAFVMLTVIVWVRPVIIGDHRVDGRLIAQPGSVGWNIAVVVSFLASGPIVALAAALAAIWTAWWLRRPAGAIAIVAAPAIAGLIEVAMKSMVGRARPVTAVLSGESGNGYPSGHVSGFSALVVAVYVVWVLQKPDTTAGGRRSARGLVGSSIALVAWSRVAMGAHYMSDTLGGALLGVTVGLVCPWLCDITWDRWRGISPVPSDRHPRTAR